MTWTRTRPAGGRARWKPDVSPGRRAPLAAGLVGAALLALVVVPTTSVQGVTGEDWPMFRGNLARTGARGSSSGGLGELRWSYPTEIVAEPGTTSYLDVSSAAVAGGKVFFGSWDGHVYALDATNGTLRWRYKADAGVVSSPAVVGDVVFSGTHKGVVALDVGTGGLKWKALAAKGFVASPAVDGGKLFIAEYPGTLYAIDAQTGAVLWSFKTLDSVWSSPAVNAGMVYFGSFDGNLYALDAGTGTLRWKFLTLGKITSSSPAVVSGVVYVGSTDTNVYALNAQDGSLLWKQGLGGVLGDGPYGTPAVADGRVYVGHNGRLHALNAETGAVAWISESIGVDRSSPAVAGASVFVGSRGNLLYALRASTGAVVWKAPMGGSADGSPAVVDGIAYVQSNREVDNRFRFYAFDAGRNSPVAPPPSPTSPSPSASPTSSPSPTGGSSPSPSPSPTSSPSAAATPTGTAGPEVHREGSAGTIPLLQPDEGGTSPDLGARSGAPISNFLNALWVAPLIAVPLLVVAGGLYLRSRSDRRKKSGVAAFQSRIIRKAQGPALAAPPPGAPAGAPAPAPALEAAALRPSALLVGRYELQRRLGSGGFGEVWLARDRKLDAAVVLKFLHAHWTAGEKGREAFAHEARIMRRVLHPNLVTLYDFESASGRMFLVMEHLPGGRLSDWMARKPTPAAKEALRVGLEILAGLEALHAKGIVHRDLKPSNVLFSDAGVAKVGDFGLAKLGGESTGLSMTGAQPGTLAYMSPEQAEGRPDLDARSDLYSLGVILFELLAGRPYLDLKTKTELAARNAIVSEAPDFSRATASGPIVALLRRALEKDRAKRFQTASEFRAAIETAKGSLLGTP